MKSTALYFLVCLLRPVLTGSLLLADTWAKHSVQNFSTSSVDMRKPCNIVAYDKIRGFLNWPQINKAHIILFHAPTHGDSGTRLPAKKPPQAIYAMVSMEQPKYAKILADRVYLQKSFDLLLTYSLSTIYPGTTVPNMPITYFPLNIIAPQSVLQPPRPFSEKSGYGTGVAVALFASNCDRAGATERYKYIEELMKYIPVHSYGRCFNNRKEPEMPNDPVWPEIALRRAKKVKVLSYYKFYLAFENAPVDDYVSEKVFEGLIAGTVPIYRGASSIARFMPANDSFIDANRLSAKELADTIIRLQDNEVEYNRYMQFKQRPLSKEFEQMTLMSYVHPNVLCRLCNYYFSNQR